MTLDTPVPAGIGVHYGLPGMLPSRDASCSTTPVRATVAQQRVPRTPRDTHDRVMSQVDIASNRT